MSSAKGCFMNYERVCHERVCNCEGGVMRWCRHGGVMRWCDMEGVSREGVLYHVVRGCGSR